MLIGAIAGYLYGADSTLRTTTEFSTITVSTSANAYDQVADSFANHILFLSERNATAIASQYAENATVIWTGAQDGGGLGGLYNRTEIPVLMSEGYIGKEHSFAIGSVNRTITIVSNRSATVDSTFNLFGQGEYIVAIPGLGWNAFNATVSAHDSYVYSAPNNAWMISNETWNFTSFNMEN